MLRSLLFALLLANAAFFGWSQGWLDDVVGVRAHGDREPQRLQRQVRPELVLILGQPGAGSPSTPAAPPAPRPAPAPAPVAVVEAAAPPKLACLEAGPLSAAELKLAEAALTGGQPNGSWTTQKLNRPGLWMVYLGKFANRDALLRREEELRAIKVEFDELRSPPELVPGLSLGRFEERGNAGNAQEKLSLRGIRNTRIIEVRAPSTVYNLRFERAAADLPTQLSTLNVPALAKGLTPCGG